MDAGIFQKDHFGGRTAYKRLNGEFHIFYPDQPLNGPEPDGDTIKFRPDDPGAAEVLWRPGLPRPAFNGRGMINLRFEGLDALETDFAGRHQNLAAARAGLYAADASAPSATFAVDPATLEDLVIWPKLFRRLASYFGDAFSDLSGFEAWMRRDPRNRDDRLLLPEEYDAHMHNITEVLSSGTMRLEADPADVVVVPDDFVMPETGLRVR